DLVIFRDDWLALSDPNTGYPFLPPAILWETVVALGQLVFGVLVFILLLKKKYLFPRLFIYGFIANILLDILGQILGYFTVSSILTSSEIRALLLQGLNVLVWGIYMVRSKRVKATFIN